jgi:hypothetical protein
MQKNLVNNFAVKRNPAATLASTNVTLLLRARRTSHANIKSSLLVIASGSSKKRNAVQQSIPKVTQRKVSSVMTSVPD